MQDSKRLELMGKVLAWENVTKAKTNSAGHALLEIAPRVEAMESELARMRHRIECLRGGLKSAAGWLLDADDLDGHEKCLEMAGDMEPPLMGSNVELSGLRGCLRSSARTPG